MEKLCSHIGSFPERKEYPHKVPTSVYKARLQLSLARNVFCQGMIVLLNHFLYFTFWNASCL